MVEDPAIEVHCGGDQGMNKNFMNFVRVEVKAMIVIQKLTSAMDSTNVSRQHGCAVSSVWLDFRFAR